MRRGMASLADRGVSVVVISMWVVDACVGWIYAGLSLIRSSRRMNIILHNTLLINRCVQLNPAEFDAAGWICQLWESVEGFVGRDIALVCAG
jgi:hypothetical protein